MIAKTANSHARRLKVVEAVAVMGMSHKDAAEFAGVSTSSVSTIINNPEVKKYIARIQKQEQKRLSISREQVLEGILEAINDAKMLSEPATQIRGWEQIAKIEGHFAPERRVIELPTETLELMQTLQTLDSTELARLAGQQELIDLNDDDFHRVEDGE